MATRARVIYQSDNVYVGPTPATGIHLTAPGGVYGDRTQLSGGATNSIDQLTRVQSAAWSAAVTRQNVNQFGELAAIDQVILEQPTVSLDLTWIVASLANEKYIGLTVTPTGQTSQITCISGILTKASDEKNYFVIQA